MKKLIILSAIIILAVTTNAQNAEVYIKKEIKKDKKELAEIKHEKKEERKALKKLEGKEVSYQAKQAFYSDFGDIPVSTWVRTDNFDEATFTKDGQVTKAYYDDKAQLVGTTTQKKFSDIPLSAQKEINKKYAGHAKKEVIFFDDNEANDTDMIMYGTQFEDADSYFVVLSKNNKNTILHVNMDGLVSFFK